MLKFLVAVLRSPMYTWPTTITSASNKCMMDFTYTKMECVFCEVPKRCSPGPQPSITETLITNSTIPPAHSPLHAQESPSGPSEERHCMDKQHTSSTTSTNGSLHTCKPAVTNFTSTYWPPNPRKKEETKNLPTPRESPTHRPLHPPTAPYTPVNLQSPTSHPPTGHQTPVRKKKPKTSLHQENPPQPKAQSYAEVAARPPAPPSTSTPASELSQIREMLHTLCNQLLNR
ncbi:hypothetical protein ROHU_021881 [Labeo rohita]|uniref:Uncharacterized protein n=1 Tax=Labeo rohita TaxID=84645 RepID=A0A498MTE7_LABRO|nr:hypothetical protein ROHU_021881 [Labeo rohita]